MELEWDSAKNDRNIVKHGFDFVDAAECFRFPLLVREDTRHDYGERRWVALGRVREVIISLVFTRRGERVRVISLRRANRREREIYIQFRGTH